MAVKGCGNRGCQMQLQPSREIGWRLDRTALLSIWDLSGFPPKMTGQPIADNYCHVVSATKDVQTISISTKILSKFMNAEP